MQHIHKSRLLYNKILCNLTTSAVSGLDERSFFKSNKYNFLKVTCDNFSNLCVKGIDGGFYTFAYTTQLQDSNYFNTIIKLYSLCEFDGTSKKKFK